MKFVLVSENLCSFLIHELVFTVFKQALKRRAPRRELILTNYKPKL
jgi:hypothetical protein